MPENEPENGRWSWPELNLMGSYLKTLPILAEVVSPSRWPHDASQIVPILWQPSPQFKNDHLQYAATWYTLAVCLSFMTYILLK